jgi:cobalt-zinc-cadmium efflux system membrane fusion protein
MTPIVLFRALAPTALLLLASCSGGGTPDTPTSAEAGEAAAAEPARGPNGGKMFVDGDFAIELAIFEDGVPPQYRAWATAGGKPVPPADVDLTVTLKRLGGKTDVFAFAPKGAFLVGDGVVAEPHSFDIGVAASHAGKRHQWTLASYEGRSTMTPAQATASGIRIETAGPQSIAEERVLFGTVALSPSARSEVRARFPGKVVAVMAEVGQAVRAGQTLARVESNESLQVYAVTAPRAGVIAERQTSVGDVAFDAPLFVITDPGATTVVFNIFPRDLGAVRPGQRVRIETLDGAPVGSGRLSGYLPEGNAEAGTALIRALLPNPTGQWRPGMALKGRVEVSAVAVPLAVRTGAIQPFRDFQVVYANYGDTFEVRMLELGRSSPEWTEVLGGLDPGTPYAADGSFLIRADIEKSGASHDH